MCLRLKQVSAPFESNMLAASRTRGRMQLMYRSCLTEGGQSPCKQQNKNNEPAICRIVTALVCLI